MGLVAGIGLYHCQLHWVAGFAWDGDVGGKENFNLPRHQSEERVIVSHLMQSPTLAGSDSLVAIMGNETKRG